MTAPATGCDQVDRGREDDLGLDPGDPAAGGIAYMLFQSFVWAGWAWRRQ